LFKKLAVFTDIHFGLKSNSKLHNDDCEEFVDWYIEQAKKEGCETGMFCGDWHHNRNSVNITTMDASIRSLEKIGKAFDKFYFFPGNHDLYYKDSRDIQSTEFGRFIPGITMVNKITEKDDVVMVPWLVGDEWRKIGNMKCKYMFGHFELPNFFMNAMVEMPDTGELKGSDFKNQEYVFSGHFHKRQVKNNIHYLGNAFPHNYADVDDNERGMMILEWDKEPRYLNWHNCPKYKYVKLSELLDQTKDIMQPQRHLRVTLDRDLSYEEASFIKETFMKEYDCREITLIPSKKDEEINSDLDLTKFESVDEIVAKELDSIESDNYNKKTLMDIYSDLG
jgi:DNA repair exonuclease SbcCD nuclease subunit